jgi:hypothetical protein
VHIVCACHLCVGPGACGLCICGCVRFVNNVVCVYSLAVSTPEMSECEQEIFSKGNVGTCCVSYVVVCDCVCINMCV